MNKLSNKRESIIPDNLDRYNILLLTPYKKIIAEDNNYIALEIWEYSKDPKDSIIRYFEKLADGNISEHVVRSDNCTRVNTDNHFIGYYCEDLKMTTLSWLYSRKYNRTVRGKKEKSLKPHNSKMFGETEIAKPVHVEETSTYIKDRALLEEI